MKATQPAKPAIVCEILGKEIEVASVIAEIATVCARDVGQPLVIKSRVDPAVPENTLTLHLPADLAAAQHPIWCLACRLACFCPDARVSVLVNAETSFRASVNARRKLRSGVARSRTAA